MKLYASTIMEALRQVRDLEPDDISEDKDILSMSRSEVLTQVLQWEGLIGYESKIITWIRQIYGIDLDEIYGIDLDE